MISLELDFPCLINFCDFPAISGAYTVTIVLGLVLHVLVSP